MSTDATGQTYHVVQLRGQGNVPLYPEIRKAEVINQQTSESSLPPTTKAVVDYVQQAVQGGSDGGATELADLQDVNIAQVSAERQLLTGDGTAWSNSLEVVDIFNAQQEVPYPVEFYFGVRGSTVHMTLQTQGQYAGQYVDSYRDYFIYDVVWDAEAKKISSLTYWDYDHSGNRFYLELVEGSTNVYFGYIIDGSMSQSIEATIYDVSNIISSTYSPDAVPTLAGVKDVFDTEYFNIEDGKRVTPKLAPIAQAYTIAMHGYGVAAFYDQHFIVQNGIVRLRTFPDTSDYVIEHKRYSDGSWSRLWNSGWLQQGGKIVSTGAASVTVSLPMEFSSIEYNLQYTTTRSKLTETTTAQLRYYSYSNKTTTSFTVYAVVSADYGHTWYACGWSA